jgi:antitoxin component of MazEF toxin-antitoxin module
MVKTIRKVGNRNALFLEKTILELIGLPDGSQVNLVLTNGSLIVTPVFLSASIPKNGKPA